MWRRLPGVTVLVAWSDRPCMRTSFCADRSMEQKKKKKKQRQGTHVYGMELSRGGARCPNVQGRTWVVSVPTPTPRQGSRIRRTNAPRSRQNAHDSAPGGMLGESSSISNTPPPLPVVASPLGPSCPSNRLVSSVVGYSVPS
jgi:hypothetical protein